MVKIGTREEYHKKIGYGIVGKDNCPFCNPEEENIVWKGKNWYLIHNLYSYTGDERHIMAIPYRHIKFMTDLNDEEIREFKDIFKAVKDFFGEEDYFSCTRETMANRSIEHLHIQYIAGRLKGKFLRKMLEKQGFPIKQDLDI